MKVIMPLNTWANRCGYFFNAYLESKDPNDKTFYSGRDPSPNNGYNCRHPEAEEEDGVGCCFAHSCPLAYRADGLDCQRFGIDCEDCGNEECDCSDDMMVCEIPDDRFDERYMYREPMPILKEGKSNEE